MTCTTQALVIDDQRYQIQFRGFDQPLVAQLESGSSITLAPWPLASHLKALDRCYALSPDGVALNSACLADAVLRTNGVPAVQRPPWQRLALWWVAAGGNTMCLEPMPTARDLQLPLGEGPPARLRPWTSLERLAAVLASQPHPVTAADPAAATPRLGGYLRAMLEASVLLDAPVAEDLPVSDAEDLISSDGDDLALLDAGASAQLLDAVLRLNVLVAVPDDTAMVSSPMAVEATLWFCRALGWTPSQVWRTPTAELDRLARLLDQEAACRPAPLPATPQGLARYPDAVVIRVENDDAEA